MADLAENTQISVEQRVKEISICKSELVRTLESDDSEIRVASYTDKT